MTDLDDCVPFGFVRGLRFQRPFQLELDLLLVVATLMLDRELSSRRNPNPFARYLNPERSVLLQGVCEAPELSHHVVGRVHPLHVSLSMGHVMCPVLSVR